MKCLDTLPRTRLEPREVISSTRVRQRSSPDAALTTGSYATAPHSRSSRAFSARSSASSSATGRPLSTAAWDRASSSASAGRSSNRGAAGRHARQPGRKAAMWVNPPGKPGRHPRVQRPYPSSGRAHNARCQPSQRTTNSRSGRWRSRLRNAAIWSLADHPARPSPSVGVSGSGA